MRNESSEPGYREVQQLSAGSVILIVALALLAPVFVAIPVAMNRGKTLDAAENFRVTFVAVAAVAALVPASLLLLRMAVEVGEEGVVLRLDVGRVAVLPPKTVAFSSIAEAAVTSVIPIGAGVHYGWKKVSYRLRGTEGVELTLRSGSTVFIGSGHADELRAAIDRGRERAARHPRTV